MTRYNEGLDCMASSLQSSLASLQIMMLMLGMAMVSFSALMNLAEGDQDNPDSVYGEERPYRTIPSSFYWICVAIKVKIKFLLSCCDCQETQDFLLCCLLCAIVLWALSCPRQHCHMVLPLAATWASSLRQSAH
eukprot:TRINITY_DN4829_c0_g1_i4.p1 TRINITY_DN4829_c0_g1~~TRINITY_DN4829_c0_g1_i4.p1  ORF type:complete len:134 (-),score=0.76 TRINITY_DN4829_c0_g1_i4:294-695(-)